VNAKIKVALVGMGHLGQWHAQKIEKSELAQLTCVVEPFETSQLKAQSLYPQTKIVSDIEQALPLVDAVVIATPTSTHAKIMQKSILAGKHVFCEKPMVNNWQECQDLMTLVKKNKLVVQVGHSERFHQAWDLMLNDPWSSYLQNSNLMQSKRVAPFKGRATDVDVAADLLIHDLDLCLFLWKKWPSHVYATGSKYLGQQFDYIQAALSFDDGRMAVLTAARGTYLEERSLEFIGSKGVLRVDMFQRKLVARDHTGQNPVHETDYEARDHLWIEQTQFYQSILHGHPAIIDFKAGAKIVYLIEEIRNSIIQNRQISLKSPQAIGVE
jgi:predicted dehydrogenase